MPTTICFKYKTYDQETLIILTILMHVKNVFTQTLRHKNITGARCIGTSRGLYRFYVFCYNLNIVQITNINL